MHRANLAAILTITLACHGAGADGLPPAPEHFTQFEVEGHDEDAATLNRYLWYHFHHRGGNDAVLFNKEYLAYADLWLADAKPRIEERTIQEVHRANFLSMEQDGEGYVLTNQHFSHSHDGGWPFPLWTQSGRGPEEVRGVSAGWHFQPVDQVRGWVKDYLTGWNDPRWYGEEAVAAWRAEGATSEGIVDNRWRIVTETPDAALHWPEDAQVEAFPSPFLQIRWTREDEGPRQGTPYVEWKREEDEAYSKDRRVYFYPEKTRLSRDEYHSILPMFRHPRWTGTITALRIVPAPGETDVTVDIDSVFTVLDTRHTINNPIYILACTKYFNWTGDLDFLRRTINPMRKALRYQQTAFEALERNHIRVPFPGHDGRPGFTVDDDGEKTLHPGRGIGNNYWDLMPFGHDDFYATYQYYAATHALANLEEAIRANPGWDMPLGALKLDPANLRTHARTVKNEANRRFWNAETGRYYAAIDKDGNAYDYGYTFLNLDAIWYGIVTEERQKTVMDWISGARIVEDDTSTGDDIYHWRFGPRATTVRNVDWYGHVWHGPETIEWGYQIQDGGAVLGFSFYDLWARLHTYGPSDAWARLQEILAWEREVHEAGGYRAYYEADPARGSLQGGGTPGGLGIDFEFYESSLLPSIMTYGFLGIRPGPASLRISPKLPAETPKMKVRNLLYQGVRIDVSATSGQLRIEVKDRPVRPLSFDIAEKWVLKDHPTRPLPFVVSEPGEFLFYR